MTQPRNAPPAGADADRAAFLRDLRALRDGAGLQTRDLAARAHYPEDTLRTADDGPALPSLPVLEAYVRGCGARPADWEDRWRRVYAWRKPSWDWRCPPGRPTPNRLPTRIAGAGPVGLSAAEQAALAPGLARVAAGLGPTTAAADTGSWFARPDTAATESAAGPSAAAPSAPLAPSAAYAPSGPSAALPRRPRRGSAGQPSPCRRRKRPGTDRTAGRRGLRGERDGAADGTERSWPGRRRTAARPGRRGERYGLARGRTWHGAASRGRAGRRGPRPIAARRGRRRNAATGTGPPTGRRIGPASAESGTGGPQQTRPSHGRGSGGRSGPRRNTARRRRANRRRRPGAEVHGAAGRIGTPDRIPAGAPGRGGGSWPGPCALAGGASGRRGPAVAGAGLLTRTPAAELSHGRPDQGRVRLRSGHDRRDRPGRGLVGGQDPGLRNDLERRGRVSGRGDLGRPHRDGVRRRAAQVRAAQAGVLRRAVQGGAPGPRCSGRRLLRRRLRPPRWRLPRR